jgi:hypothetical protein
MLEFSEDLSVRYTGSKAVSERVLYRLKVRRGDIPYFPGGLDVSEFTYGRDLEFQVGRLLSDMGARVQVSGDRVVVGDIEVPLEGVYLG